MEVGVGGGVPLPKVMTSCGFLVPSRASKMAPSLVCGSRTNPTAPLPFTAPVTSYSAQELPLSFPLSSSTLSLAPGRLFQVMPVSLQLVPVVRTSGPFWVPPFPCTHSRSVARCTGALTPETSKRR